MDTAKEANSRPHFAALDSIRGGAALSVVLYHMSWTSFFEPLAYVRNSYLMVDLFFVLSGFVVFYAYGTKVKSGADLGRFMWLRFWRLYPMHFTFLMVFFLIELVKLGAQQKFGIISNHPAFVGNSWEAFLGNLFLAQDLHLFNQITFNYPSWSISAEFYTYLLFALTLLLPRNRRVTLIIAAIISVASLAYMMARGSGAMGDAPGDGILRCFIGFFFGVLTYAAFQATREKAQQYRAAIGWLALTSLVGFVVFVALKHKGFSDFAIYPISASVILLIALAGTAKPVQFLTSRPMIWLGTISYSIYMVHAFVEWLVAQILRFGLHVHSIPLPLHSTPVLNPNLLVGIIAVFGYLAGVLALADFTYRWIEKPMRDWSRQTKNTKLIVARIRT